MYIIKSLTFGLDILSNEKIKELFEKTNLQEIVEGVTGFASSAYHGDADWPVLQIGIEITSDDGNKNFLKECRAAKKEDYIDEYDRLKKEFLLELNEFLIETEQEEPLTSADREALATFSKWVEESEPDFYYFESSS